MAVKIENPFTTFPHCVLFADLRTGLIVRNSHHVEKPKCKIYLIGEKKD